MPSKKYTDVDANNDDKNDLKKCLKFVQQHLSRNLNLINK